MTESHFQVLPLSKGEPDSRWVVAIFAHNEARDIRAALQSIQGAAGGVAIDVYVLANGCTDDTHAQVSSCRDLIPNLWLVDISIGDKANAWNHFIHRTLPEQRIAQIENYFFMDGDCVAGALALARLAEALSDDRQAFAAGAMPSTGRSQENWRQRMRDHGTLAGGLYALTDSFVHKLRRSGTKMPCGLIGEDLFLSWLIATNIGIHAEIQGNSRCLLVDQATFSFRSLSMLSVAHYGVYLRNKWRYTLRALQYQMLVLHLNRNGMGSMPQNVQQLYQFGPLPSRTQWVGVYTPLRWVALLWIRRFRL